MFTGLIEETGCLKNVKKKSNSIIITIKAKDILKKVKKGDSISVNGVCLTAVEVFEDGFSADVMKETINKTNLKSLRHNQKINLETSISAESLMGGHIVTGHVDGIGIIKSIKKESDIFNVNIKAEPDIMRYIVNKGSVSVNGVSLTVGELGKNSFWVYLIPETLRKTNLAGLKVNEEVNLETDIIGKYVYKFSGVYKNNAKVNYDLLKRTGFIRGA